MKLFFGDIKKRGTWELDAGIVDQNIDAAEKSAEFPCTPFCTIIRINQTYRSSQSLPYFSDRYSIRDQAGMSAHLFGSVKLNRRDLIRPVSSGLFLALHFLFWMESLKLTSVASSTVILTLQPVFTMIGSLSVGRID